MKKILKKILWFIFTLLIAAILFCLLILLFTRNRNKSDTQINTYTVSIWDIENTIQIYGNAELTKEQSMTFDLPGTVMDIFVSEWEYVDKWQILAILDTENIENDIRQAEINLQNAQINYQDLNKWGTDTQIMQAENNLEQSRAALELAEQQYDELIGNSDIDTVWNTNNTVLKSTALSIKDFISQWEKAIIALDKIFGISEKYDSENDNFEDYLSSKNISYKRQTERMVSQCYDLLDELRDEYDYLDSNLNINDKDEILDLLDLSENFYEKLYDTTQMAYQALESSETNEILTAAMIWNFEATVWNYGTLAKNTLSSIVTSSNSVKNLSNSNSNDLAIQAKKNEIDNLKNTIQLQEKSLQDIRNGGTDSQKSIAANNIEQWEISVDRAKKWLESYQIIAPFNWIVRKIDFEIWDKISATNPKFIYIENPDLIEISVLLDQIDIVQVEKGMHAEIEFDAYPGIIFDWEISKIDTQPSISAGIVSYTVKIHIDKWNYMILWWMTANVKIILDKQSNAIQIPTTYIQHIWEKNYVVTSSGDLVEVKLWIASDNMTQIIDWLKDWDKIIKEVSNTSTNSFGEDLMNMHNQYNQ